MLLLDFDKPIISVDADDVAVFDSVVEFLRQRFNGKGHEKSFVCGKPFHYRLFEGNIGSLFVGTIILHIKLNIKELIIKGYDAVPNDNQHIWACHLIIPS